MIKAEVIEHEGVEVPNWVHRCRDVLTSAPTIGTVTLLVVAFCGFAIWQNHKNQLPVSSTTGVQSIPASTSDLKVMSPGTSLDVSAPTTVTLPSTTSPGNSGSAQSSAASSPGTSPIGPAPANSLNSLQPSGSAQQPGGLTQAVGQTIQSAGNATNNLLNGLGL